MQRKRKLYEQWKQLANQMGRGNALLYLVDRLLYRLSPSISLHRYYLVAQPVAERRLLPPHRGGNIQVRPVGPDDPIVYTFPTPKEEIRTRYQHGAVCFAAFKREKILGYMWVLLGSYREPGHRCTLVPTPEGAVAWDFDIYIDPSDRLGLTFARLWDTTNSYLRAKNIRWTLSRISAFNPTSITSHRRLGARLMYSTVFFAIGSWQAMLANIPPYIHFSASRKTAPTIVVRAPTDKNSVKQA